jgi:hypothetical protein
MSPLDSFLSHMMNGTGLRQHENVSGLDGHAFLRQA